MALPLNVAPPMGAVTVATTVPVTTPPELTIVDAGEVTIGAETPNTKRSPLMEAVQLSSSM